MSRRHSDSAAMSRGSMLRAHARGRRFPDWSEHRVQFITRYGFILIALSYFYYTPGIAPTGMSHVTLCYLLAIYFFVNSLNMVAAWRLRYSWGLARAAMLLDMVYLSAVIVNDPYPIPLSMIIYVIIVLGNGMRYGLPLFREALAASFLSAASMLFLRPTFGGVPPGSGFWFLPLLIGLVLVYSYVLMRRIDNTQRQLEILSYRDPLTGLLNRRGLEQALGHLTRGAPDRPITALLADLDSFKAINDNFGHSHGDRLLEKIGDALSQDLGPDAVVCRFGGDEFVLILPDTPRAGADRLIERLQQRIGELGQPLEAKFGITFGVVETTAGELNFERLLHAVDHDMYSRKRGARRRQAAEPNAFEAGPSLGLAQ